MKQRNKEKKSAAPVRRKPARYHAKIVVAGVGGAGGNALKRMKDSFRLKGVEFVAMNTDAQDLEGCGMRRSIYLGHGVTKGLGAGMNPELGRQAAEESRAAIGEAFKGADLVFVTAGFGGGTGSGAAPLIAEIAREAGALVVAVVTRPFSFEGSERMRIANDAIARLKDKVDTLIIIPNDRIFSIIKKDTPLMKAFAAIDDVLRFAVQGVSELIALHGMINVDFADVRAIMQDAGSALIGIGASSGSDRAAKAIASAISSPLLEVSIEGAHGVLFVVFGGKDMKMSEVNDIAKTINASVDPSAKIIFGAYHDRRLPKGQLKIIVIATGFAGDTARERERMVALFPSLDEEKTAEPSAFDRSSRDGKPRSDSPRSARAPKEEVPAASKETAKKDQDFWEVPAFIRKRRNVERS